MKTLELFRQDVYMTEADARIVSVSADGSGFIVTLDQTLFFPVGGGQSCDTGRLGDFNVVDVYSRGGEIFHRIEASDGAHAEPPGEGDTVRLSLDWERRFDNMQRHCGEHILSGIFYREFGGVNRGFHMGEQYMTIDISLEDDPYFTEITPDMAKLAEFEANKVIWQNLPVITRHFDKKEDAEGLPLRKALAIDEDITIVCVGSVDEPADCVACCGTHPSTAGQVGLIKIYKVEVNKGMYRVYFEAGRRAFERYQQQADVLTLLERELSAGGGDLMDKYRARQEKNREARTQLHLLKKEIVRREAEEIKEELAGAKALKAGAAGGAAHQDAGAAAGAAGRIVPVVRRYSLLSPDDLSSIAGEIAPDIPEIAFLVHEPTMTVFLCSSGSGAVDCGKLVKENASIYNGKGGGSKALARAIFSKAEYVDLFIDLIEKHLR